MEERSQQIPNLGSRKKKEQLENREKERLKINMNEENMSSHYLETKSSPRLNSKLIV